MLGNVADQALYGLVLHQTDADKRGILQARGKEVEATNHPVEELRVHLPEIGLLNSPEACKTDRGSTPFGRREATRAHRAVWPPG